MKTKHHKTLVILAAGRGTRFGGAKQLIHFGCLKKTLMEYNIDHAIAAGFTKLVFIIQPSHKQQFLDQIIKYLPLFLESHLVFQEMVDIPAMCSISKNRKRPLGTAHALWCARNLVKENFVVINADDYYGSQSFILANNHLEAPYAFMVAYLLKNTLSCHGGVNRGMCELAEDNVLQSLTEFEDIKRGENNVITGKSNGNRNQSLDENCLISMNFWGFNSTIFSTLEKLLINTFTDDSIEQTECYLPNVIALLNNKCDQPLKVLASQDEWFGVTYAADSAHVNNALTELANNGLFSSLSKNVNNGKAIGHE